MKIKILIAVTAICFIISCDSASHNIRVGSTLDESNDIKSADIKEALDKGIRFLLTAQNPDGSWVARESAAYLGETLNLGTVASHDAFRQAVTALGCMAIMKAKGYDDERRAALNKGLRYLMTQHPEGRATLDVMYHSWTLLYVTQAFSRAIMYGHSDIPKDDLTASARKWLKMLQNMQAADGGWCYYDFGYGLRQPSGRISVSFTTGAAVDALWDAQKAGLEVDPKAINSALRALERMRTADKSFIYGTYAWFRPAWILNRPKSALGRVQPCNLALFRNDKIPVTDLKLGLDRLFEFHHFLEVGQYHSIPHESWYGISGYFFFFGHFYAAEVISQLPRDQQNHYWKALARALLQCQQPDGSWWDYPMFGYEKLYGTAFAVLSLSPALETLSK